MRTLLANATVITMNPTRDVLDTDILIENGVIADMGPGLAGRPENAGAERVDLSGRIVIPGLIQSHMHVTQSLFRGLADEMELMDWLQRRIWPLEGAHTPETNAAAARLAAAEGLRSGVTAFIDMGTAHCQDAIFETMRDVGMRGLFGKCMLDSGGTDVPAALMEDTETCLRESERLMNRWHMSAGGRLRYAFAPRFVPSCTETLLTRTRDMARANGVRLHTHASENKGECAYVESLVHMRNLRYLHSIGYTGEDVILAHCIWIDDDENPHPRGHGHPCRALPVLQYETCVRHRPHRRDACRRVPCGARARRGPQPYGRARGAAAGGHPPEGAHQPPHGPVPASGAGNGHPRRCAGSGAGG